MRRPPDREMSLVADEGMRILRKTDTNCPYFIESNDELWDSWREIQRTGHGADESHWLREGWRIRLRHLPNGGAVMTLDIRFDPYEK